MTEQWENIKMESDIIYVVLSENDQSENAFVKMEDKPFSQLRDKSKKEKRHPNSCPDECEFCGEYLPKICMLNAHIILAHPIAAKDYKKCEGCDKVFKVGNNSSRLYAHQTRCEQKRQQKREQKRERKREQKKNAEEDKLPGRTCPRCQKVFHNRTSRNRHYATNACVKKIYSIMCKKCGDIFESNIEKNKHKVHMERITCEECGIVYRADKHTQHKKTNQHQGFISPRPIRPLSKLSRSQKQRRVGEIVDTYNREAAEGGEEARILCWEEMIQVHPELADSEEEIDKKDALEIMTKLHLSGDQLQDLLTILTDKWGRKVLSKEVVDPEGEIFSWTEEMKEQVNAWKIKRG